MKKLILSVLLILVIWGIVWLGISYFSYASGTWVDSANNVQYTYLAHNNFGGFIGGVIYPYYGKDGIANHSVSVQDGKILLNEEEIHFPRGKLFLVISKEGRKEFIDLPPDFFVANKSTKYAQPNIEAMKSAGIWSQKIEPMLGNRGEIGNARGNRK